MTGLHQIIKAAYEKKSRWRVQISKPGPGAMNHTFRLRREDNNVNVIKKKFNQLLNPKHEGIWSHLF